MSEPALAAPPRAEARPWRRHLVTAAAVGAVGLATALAAVLAGPGAALAPVLLVGAGLAAWRAPLRWSVSALLFLLLVLPLSSDGEEIWKSPLMLLGDLLRSNLDAVVPALRVKASGLELITAFLLGLAAWRRARGNRMDVAGQVPTARLTVGVLAVFVVAVVGGVAVGMANGGRMEVVIWQARPLLHYPALFLLFQVAYRGPSDHRLIGQIVVLSAVVKAFTAVYVLYFVLIPSGRKFEYATNHFDSILFAMAAIILLLELMEGADRKRLANAALILPVLIWGMVANNRRLVWVELAFALGAIYLLNPWRRWKRAVARFVVVAAPVLLLYGAAGWGSDSKLFAPVKMVRSVVDAKVDRSTWDREVENWNLIMSMWERPLLGKGFGHEYTEFMKGDDLALVGFKEYRVLPHNAVLGLLLFAGPVGFTGIWAFFAVAVFLAQRSFHRATSAEQRIAALAATATAFVILLQAWGDLAFTSTQAKVFAALALVVASKLAVVTGAWPGAGPVSGGRRARTSGPAPSLP